MAVWAAPCWPRARKCRVLRNLPAPPLFTSLKNGMQQLVETLVPRLNQTSLLANTPVQSIQPEAGGWTVSASLKPNHYDSVILAVPALAAAQLLAICSPELSAELAAIGYSSSITVGLGYNRDVRQSLPPGFGFLVPRSEGKRLLAATFVHNKFPHRAPDDRALLRCFFAGPNAEDIWQLSDDVIIAIVRDELQQILGLRATPLFARVYKWKSAMAQYGVGHLERLLTASNASAGSCPPSPLPATATAASASPIASAPVAKRQKQLPQSLESSGLELK